MERHAGLIREILTQVAERSTNADNPVGVDAAIGDFTRQEVYGHIQMCQRAGLLRTRLSRSEPAGDTIIGLTWEGYAELERLRTTQRLGRRGLDRRFKRRVAQRITERLVQRRRRGLLTTRVMRELVLQPLVEALVDRALADVERLPAVAFDLRPAPADDVQTMLESLEVMN